VRENQQRPVGKSIPTPKDTAERQKMGIFGSVFGEGTFGAKIQIQIFI
jgi:hypothetical protein